MNLSPVWVAFLSDHGMEAIHWSQIGPPDAQDSMIMKWARDHACVVFTHDLDFGILLAHTNEEGPSVIQIRTQNLSPPLIGEMVIAALRTFRAEIEKGALITIDESRSRVRILPIAKDRRFSDW